MIVGLYFTIIRNATNWSVPYDHYFTFIKLLWYRSLSFLSCIQTVTYCPRISWKLFLKKFAGLTDRWIFLTTLAHFMTLLTPLALPYTKYFGITTENFICKIPHYFSSATTLLIYSFHFWISFTFNLPFNQHGILPTICVYKPMHDFEYISIELDSSVPVAPVLMLKANCTKILMK